MSDHFKDSSETADLIEKARLGDRSAFDSLFSRYADELRRFVDLRLDQRLRVRVSASDIVQDTHLEAFRRFADFCQRRPMPFKLWLRKNAYERLINVRRDHLHTAKRAVGREQNQMDQSSMLLANRVSDKLGSPSEQVTQKEFHELIAAKIEQMNEEDRNILLMRHVDGMTHQEIACMLGIEHAAARKRYARALVKLESLLRDSGLSG